MAPPKKQFPVPEPVIGHLLKFLKIHNNTIIVFALDTFFVLTSVTLSREFSLLCIMYQIMLWLKAEFSFTFVGQQGEPPLFCNSPVV